VGPLGIPEMMILGLGLLPFLLFLIPVALFALGFKRRAARLGYASVGAYLAAAPRSDAEKRDAVDLALKGLVISLLGLIVPPFVLGGLIPLFYGGRKLVYASLGLGLIDDADEPRA